MYPQHICFKQKYVNSKKKSTENCHFYSSEKSLCIAWACFRNGMSMTTKPALPLKPALNLLLGYRLVLVMKFQKRIVDNLDKSLAYANYDFL